MVKHTADELIVFDYFVGLMLSNHINFFGLSNHNNFFGLHIFCKNKENWHEGRCSYFSMVSQSQNVLIFLWFKICIISQSDHWYVSHWFKFLPRVHKLYNMQNRFSDNGNYGGVDEEKLNIYRTGTQVDPEAATGGSL